MEPEEYISLPRRQWHRVMVGMWCFGFGIGGLLGIPVGQWIS